jgi:hypothetical protein
MQIYTAETALREEDAVLSPHFSASGRISRNIPTNESSLSHFCAFVDFYTRKTADPMSTALACEKHAEALDITPQDATPENMRMLVDTMLEVIDHLEKKWLDEQIRHEERMQKHREDVSRLYQQIRELQPPKTRRHVFYEKGMQWFHSLWFRKEHTPKRRVPKRSSRREKGMARHRTHATNIVNANVLERAA